MTATIASPVSSGGECTPATKPATGEKRSGHIFTFLESDTSYNLRVLRLPNALYAYVGPAEQETFVDMAMATVMPGGSVLGTTIAGEPMNQSHQLAMLMARRLAVPVFTSCNIGESPEVYRAVVQTFVDAWRTHPEHFEFKQ